MAVLHDAPQGSIFHFNSSGLHCYNLSTESLLLPGATEAFFAFAWLPQPCSPAPTVSAGSVATLKPQLHWHYVLQPSCLPCYTHRLRISTAPAALLYLCNMHRMCCTQPHCLPATCTHFSTSPLYPHHHCTTATVTDSAAITALLHLCNIHSQAVRECASETCQVYTPLRFTIFVVLTAWHCVVWWLFLLQFFEYLFLFAFTLY